MDIAGLSTSMSLARVQTDVGTAMLGKSLDTQQSQGQGVVNMIDAASMERSVAPSVGSNFDMSV